MSEFTDKLDEWKERIALLDESIKAIAKRPIDITNPNWVAKLKTFLNPLEDVGVKAETENLLSELSEAMLSFIENYSDIVLDLDDVTVEGL